MALRLFDSFFTTKDVGKGSGLGLFISYQIVIELHQGQLDCNSTPGKGAEFIITLLYSSSYSDAVQHYIAACRGTAVPCPYGCTSRKREAL